MAVLEWTKMAHNARAQYDYVQKKKKSLLTYICVNAGMCCWPQTWECLPT